MFAVNQYQMQGKTEAVINYFECSGRNSIYNESKNQIKIVNNPANYRGISLVSILGKQSSQLSWH